MIVPSAGGIVDIATRVFERVVPGAGPVPVVFRLTFSLSLLVLASGDPIATAVWVTDVLER